MHLALETLAPRVGFPGGGHQLLQGTKPMLGFRVRG